MFTFCFICQHQHALELGCLSRKIFLELPGNGDEISKLGIAENYMTRPNQDDMKNICLAVFISYYFKPAKV